MRTQVHPFKRTSAALVLACATVPALAGDWLYWTDTGAGRIRRATLNGANLITLATLPPTWMA